MSFLRDWRATAGLWVVMLAVYFFYPLAAPIDFIGGDSVEPKTVKAGEVVTITRNLRFEQKMPMQVTRTMVKGDCKINCDLLDLTHGRILFDVGEYNLRREHIIPLQASPGLWKLKFSIAWSDAFGRQQTKDLPELSIEVVK